MNARVGVVHHPSRRRLLETFAGLDPVVFVDPDPAGVPLAWRTYRHALERFVAGELGCTHLALLQDDTCPVDGFMGALERTVAAHPDIPVSLFVGTNARVLATDFWEACHNDEWFFTLDAIRQRWLPVVAVVWPIELAARFLEWCDGAGFDAKRYKADDAVVGEWARTTGERVLGTVPCLVEHPDVERSLVDGPVGRRVALCMAYHGDEFVPPKRHVSL